VKWKTIKRSGERVSEIKNKCKEERGKNVE
jgi:hypothetical protein